MRIDSKVEERAIALAQYIIDSKDTVRGAAKKFGVSKSTVHTDVPDLQILDKPQIIVISKISASRGELTFKLAIRIWYSFVKEYSNFV